MNCVVTAGPTYEPLDQVRRLTNSSTGRLGTELANHLADHGHEVTLLIGEHATWTGPRRARATQVFSTTADLKLRLSSLASNGVAAVFHAAAVSDFSLGQIFARAADGTLTPLRSGKIPTRSGGLLAELVPTPKLLPELRGWFPAACIVGWKYEVEGGRDGALAAGERQLAEGGSHVCVVNGPAYGPGFGLLIGRGSCRHLETRQALFEALELAITGR